MWTIRRRSLNEYFEGGARHGLVSLLGGERSADEVIFRPDAFEADVILGDKSRTNAADLFSSERFREFMAQVRTQYDIIIIDIPPVLVVPDARIIAQQADALLFSVRWDSTSHAQVTEAMRQLQNVEHPAHRPHPQPDQPARHETLWLWRALRGLWRLWREIARSLTCGVPER
jgi:Mrp family chromosome partitioning ATPase